MANPHQKTAPIREKRLGAIQAWQGHAHKLLAELQSGPLAQRIRTFAQDETSDLGRVLALLGSLEGIAVVVHGPAGCAAPLRQAHNRHLPWLVTNITERESILGGDAKLRSTIRQADQHYRPAAIVVVATPVVTINNDEIDSVCEALSEELALPVIPVYSDGFRSKIGATGLDVAAHALLKHGTAAVQPAHLPSVALLAFSESHADLQGLQALLGQLGLASLVFPRFSHFADISLLARASLNILLNPAESDYTGQLLAELGAKPPLRAGNPIGLQASCIWLRAIATATGREAQAETIIAFAQQQLAAALAGYAPLRGKRVFLNAGPDEIAGLWDFARAAGLEVVAIKMPYIDASHASQLQPIAQAHADLPVLVADGQPFEEISLLQSLQPDFYIGHTRHILHASRYGVAPVALDDLAYHGFAGIHNLLARLLAELQARPLWQFLGAAPPNPYTASWQQKSPGWHIKHEVR